MFLPSFIFITNSLHFSFKAHLLLIIYSLHHLFKHLLSDCALLLHSANIFRERVLLSILLYLVWVGQAQGEVEL